MMPAVDNVWRRSLLLFLTLPDVLLLSRWLFLIQLFLPFQILSVATDRFIRDDKQRFCYC